VEDEEEPTLLETLPIFVTSSQKMDRLPEERKHV